MPTPTKINSGNIKDLLTKGVNPKTIELLEGIRKTGGIFKNKSDLVKIGITKDEIDKIIPNISFAEPDPVQIIKTAIIKTDLKGRPGYTLAIRYQNKDNLEFIDSLFPILPTDKTEIKYDDKIVGDRFFIAVKAPGGELTQLEFNGVKGRQIEIPKNSVNNASVKIDALNSITTQTGKALTPSTLKGRLLSNNPSRKLEKVQIVIEVSLNNDATGSPLYFPVCFAVTEQAGYFFTSQLQFVKEGDSEKLIAARARIGLVGVNPLTIPLENIAVAANQGNLPEKLILFIEETNLTEATETNCDCDCNELDFHDKKVLDEFSFYTVVRTTEPMIEAYEVNDVEEVDLADIIDDEEVRKVLTGIKLPPLLVRDFITKNGSITKSNHKSLLASASKFSQIKNLRNASFDRSMVRLHRGRIDLDGRNSIDWDEKPTIYQATSIAHGHLLHFKQEWFADGYSIGDLLYSLPLAPGQKKQIVIFDWDRKDSASNTQQFDYQESLYNSLSRDRDVNEVAKATLNENISGSSSSSTSGWAIGGGIGAIIPIEVPIGALIGAGGGSGSGSSSANQTSSRTTTASSQQQINDRTVQAASSVRSQRATVIQTVSQGERFQVSAEVVANYNHCHAMTIEYFEVLRHFEIRTRLTEVQECLFVPLKVSPFDRKKALRWRDILSRCLKKRNLLPGFDALERIDEELESSSENYYDELGIPKNRYAEEELEYIEGEIYLEFQLKRPANNDLDEFVLANWGLWGFFIGDPLEFYNRFIRQEQKKDEAFAKHAGPSISEAVMDELRFFAIKNGVGGSSRRLPVDATLLSDFKNKKKLNVSLRMSGQISGIRREDIDYVKITLDGATTRSEPLKRLENDDALKIIVHSGSMRYRTKSLHEFLFRDSNIKNDLTLDGDDVRVFTPLSAKALKKPRLEDVEVSNSLLHQLNENIEYYHQCIWSKMDAQRRFMLLDGLIAPGKGNGRSVASVVENKLIGIVGNCIVMPVAPGFQLDPILDDKINLFDHYYENPKDPTRLSLPTKGVFAEAVMGKCNSCEKKDESRFWRWEESPIPDSPTTINPFTLPTPQNIPPNNLQPKDFPTPIINLQNGPILPDPQGFGSLVSLLSNPNLFRDITGLTENQKNALAALQSAFSTAQFFGSKAADLTGQAANLFSKNQAFEAKQNALEQIKKAKENGLITEKQAQDLTKEAFSSILGDSGSTVSQSVDDIAKTEKKVKDGEITPEDGEAIKQMVKDKEKARTENESVTNKPAVDDAIQSFENVEEGSLQIEDGDRKINVTKGAGTGTPATAVAVSILSEQDLPMLNLNSQGIDVRERITEKGRDRIYELFVSSTSIEDVFLVLDIDLSLDNTVTGSSTSDKLIHQAVVHPGANKVLFASKKIARAVTNKIGVRNNGFSNNFFTGDPNASITPRSTLFLLPFPLSVGGSNEFTCGQGPNLSPGAGITHSSAMPESRFAVDFTMPMGTDIFASRDGVVISVIDTHPDLPVDASTGLTDPPPTDADLATANIVSVRHNDGTIAQYAHLQQSGARVAVGDPVIAGTTLIGLSGNSGFSTGPHLHMVVTKAKHDIAANTTSFVSISFRYKGANGRGVTPRKGQKFKRT